MVKKDKKIIAIVQARLNSVRLPGKILKEINGMAAIELLHERLKKSKGRLSVDIPILIKTKKKISSKLYTTNEISINRMRKINKSFKLEASLRMGKIDGIPGIKPPSTCVLKKI